MDDISGKQELTLYISNDLTITKNSLKILLIKSNIAHNSDYENDNYLHKKKHFKYNLYNDDILF